MSTAEKYVTAAYLGFLVVVLLYVVIYSFKLARLEREVAALYRPSVDSAEDERAREETPALVA